MKPTQPPLTSPFAAAFGSRGSGANRDGYVAASDGRRWEADNVVVATGSTQAPRLPDFASELAPSIIQLHSSDYRNPDQLQNGRVLIVGLGNSGAEIALEVSRTHLTVIAGKPGGELPVRHGRTAARFVLPVVRFLGLHVLTLDTPIGRKAAPHKLTHADPLIRTKSKDLAAAGVEFVPRVTGVQDGRPVVAGSPLDDVANVIWCTGYRESFDWIEPPVFDGGGRPRQHRGVATDVPGTVLPGRGIHVRRSFGYPPRLMPGRPVPGRKDPGRRLASGTQRLVPEPPGHAFRQPPGDHAIENQHR